MNAQEVHPDEAAQALDAIRARRDQVVDANIAPDWFWYAVAGLTAGFIAAVDSRRPVLIGVGTVVFCVGIAVVVAKVAFRARPQVRPQLIGGRGGLAIAGTVLLPLVLGLGVAFGLSTLDVRYAATISGLVVAVTQVIAGPRLTRHLRRTMAERPLGNR